MAVTQASQPTRAETSTRGSEPPRRSVRERLGRLDVKASPYVYIAPFFVLFGVFGLFPLLYTGWVSLHSWDLLGSDHPFVGLANYTKLLHDPYFWNAFRNSAVMFVLSTAPQLLLALWIAHVLNRRMRLRTLWRMGVALPYVTSVVAAALIFNHLFARDYGLINDVLQLFGVPRIDWQASSWAGQSAVSLMVVWRWTGYNALIYLAAMQAISMDLYEAAALDGASSFQQFRRVTIPLLRPTIVFTVIVSTIGGLQLFTEPFVFMTGGNPAQGGSDRQVQTLAMYMYENGFSLFKFGYASAIAWMLFLIVVIVALVNFSLTRRIHSTR